MVTQAPSILKKSQKREVLRGKLAGWVVTLGAEDARFPGFWWCDYEKKSGKLMEVLLNGEQLGPPR